ncbi:HAD-like protein, partial [Rozella allomycis CSF55]
MPNSSDNKKTLWLPYALLSAVGLSILYRFGRADEEYPNLENENAFQGFIRRVPLRVEDFWNYYSQPRAKKLLPDPLPAPYQKPYTLVINLDKFIVCHVFDKNIGKWRIAKRPGIEEFLYNLAFHYELVVFTKMNANDAVMIMDNLDPLHAIVGYRLYSDSTHFKNGVHLKDIGMLNRDMKKVVMLDYEEPSLQLHPENSVKIKAWNGEFDYSIDSYIDFFETLAASNTEDVREYLKAYKDKNVVEDFDKLMREKYDIARENQLKTLQVMQTASGIKKWLGLKTQNTNDEYVVPTYDEFKVLKRQERQKIVEHYKKELAAEVEKQKKMQEEYMKEHPFSVIDMARALINGPQVIQKYICPLGLI